MQTKLNPILHDGSYVFVTTTDLEGILRSSTVMEFKEAEGTTLILKKEEADRLTLNYEYEAAWITIKAITQLDDVGLTAKFSTALAAAHISCNVVAGFYHDHIFVDAKKGNQAIEILKGLVW